MSLFLSTSVLRSNPCPYTAITHLFSCCVTVAVPIHFPIRHLVAVCEHEERPGVVVPALHERRDHQRPGPARTAAGICARSAARRSRRRARRSHSNSCLCPPYRRAVLARRSPCPSARASHIRREPRRPAQNTARGRARRTPTLDILRAGGYNLY